MRNCSNGYRVVKVELFGPFRAFGSPIEVPVEGDISFDELVELLEARVGAAFAERARKKNTTFILNNRVVPRNTLCEVEISPGNRVAFALLLGGG